MAGFAPVPLGLHRSPAPSVEGVESVELVSLLGEPPGEVQRYLDGMLQAERYYERVSDWVDGLFP